MSIKDNQNLAIITGYTLGVTELVIAAFYFIAPLVLGFPPLLFVVGVLGLAVGGLILRKVRELQKNPENYK